MAKKRHLQLAFCTIIIHATQPRDSQPLLWHPKIGALVCTFVINYLATRVLSCNNSAHATRSCLISKKKSVRRKRHLQLAFCTTTIINTCNAAKRLTAATLASENLCFSTYFSNYLATPERIRHLLDGSSSTWNQRQMHVNLTLLLAQVFNLSHKFSFRRNRFGATI